MHESQPPVESGDPLSAGEPLSHYIARVGRLPVLQGLALVLQLLSAVEEMHRSGLRHGGITRDGLRVSRTGRLVLPGPGGGVASAADRRSDVRAAAVVGYELLAGGAPFDAGGREPRSVRRLRPELPADLDPVFRQALARGPDDGFASAADLSAALQAALAPCWAGAEAPSAAPGVRQAGTTPRPASPEVPPPQTDHVDQVLPQRPVPVSVGTAWELGLVLCVWAAVAAFAAAMMGSPRTPVRPPGPALHLDLAAVPGRVVPPEPAAQIAMGAAPTAIAPSLVSELATPAPREPAGTREPAPAPIIDEAPRPQRTAPVPAPASHRKQAPHAKHAAASAKPGRHVARVAQQPDPRAACTGSPLAPDLCTAFRCATSEFRHHPVCVRMHHDGEVARARLAETRP